jgi:hypothetical protein
MSSSIHYPRLITPGIQPVGAGGLNGQPIYPQFFPITSGNNDAKVAPGLLLVKLADGTYSVTNDAAKVVGSTIIPVGVIAQMYDSRYMPFQGVNGYWAADGGKTVKAATACNVTVHNPAVAKIYTILEDADGGRIADSSAGQYVSLISAGTIDSSGNPACLIDSSSATGTAAATLPFKLIRAADSEESASASAARYWEVELVISTLL